VLGSAATLTLPGEAVDALAELVASRTASLDGAKTPSPYMTIPEAAEYLRCSRQRIDDLLSQGRLTRHKEGRRTLVRRDELERHLGVIGR
jgi:excisionase family DNA binding protein